MAKFLYSATMSLDGFIAAAGGDMSWLNSYLGPDPTMDRLIPQVGALLIGRRTFGGDDPYKDTAGEGEAFGGGWSGPQFVLTHHRPDAPVDGVTFLDDFEAAVAAASAAAQDKYVNVLGADVARQCLSAGVLDEVLVGVAPILLGAGTRLFEHAGGTEVRLQRLSVEEVPHATNLWYQVLR